MVGLADASGTATKSYQYDAFGVEQDPVDTDMNPWRYCAEYYDVETKTIYLRARNYDPVIGRFTGEDPSMDGLNWYTYCGGNPVMFVDPWGLKDVWIREHMEPYGASVDWDDKTRTARVLYCGRFESFKASDYKITGGKMYVDDSILNKKFGLTDMKYNMNDFNCMAYAYGVTYGLVQGDPKPAEVKTSPVNNKDVLLPNNAYLVAYRYSYASGSGYPAYHYLKQDPITGAWWEKPNFGKEIKYLGKINPNDDRYWSKEDSEYKTPTHYQIVTGIPFWSR